MRKLYLIFILSLPIVLFGVNYTDYTAFGYRVEGGTNTDLGLFDNPITNPSVLWDGQKILVKGAFEMAAPTEIRNENVFDSYSNAIGERTVYYGQNFYVYPTLAWGSIKLHKYFRLQAGYSVLYSNEYTYSKITYDGYYVPLYSNNIYSMGRIENWGIQAISGWKDVTSLGLGVYYMFGKPYLKESKIYLPTGDIEYQKEIFVNKVYGFMFNLGGWTKITDRIKIFYAYDIPFSLRYTYDVYSYSNGIRQIDSIGQQKDVSFPGIARIGARFLVSGILPTTINVKTSYYFNHNVDVTKDDALEYEFTVSHLMSKDNYFYYGFGWEGLAQNNNVSRVKVLSGVRFLLNKSELTIAGGYRYTSFYGDQIGADDSYHHEERDFFISTGVVINIAE